MLGIVSKQLELFSLIRVYVPMNARAGIAIIFLLILGFNKHTNFTLHKHTKCYPTVTKDPGQVGLASVCRTGGKCSSEMKSFQEALGLTVDASMQNVEVKE